MKIYLVRHGESVSGSDDNKRALSAKGEEEIQRLANFIKPMNLQINRIWQSEKFRAQQTAAILSKSIRTENRIETKKELAPESDPDLIIDELNACGEDTMLVGHMPFMGRLAAKLVLGNEYADIVYVKTGSVICLEQVQTRQWIIGWMLIPEILMSK
jgi:phosphohistidine phosphatase